MRANEELLAYIFSNTRHPLAVQFSDWLEASPYFRAFASLYRDKIRKKVRVVPDPEGLRDLQAELEVARRLTGQRSFSVEYERYAASKVRGADFSVLYKTHTRFDVEVARLRPGPNADGFESGKVMHLILAKLPQLQAGMINVLALVTGATPGADEALAGALKLMQMRADSKDEHFFSTHGFQGAREFHRHLGRLSAVMLVGNGPGVLVRPLPQARHPLPADIARLLN